MIRRSWIVGVILFCVCSHGRENGISQKKTPFGTAIQAGMGLRRFENTCIWFQLFFVSDDFFSGLHSKETRDGREFTKKGVKYTVFPDHLIVDVQASLFKCPAQAGRIEPPGYGEGLMSDPGFGLAWKDKAQSLHSAALISAKEQHQVPSLRWDYFLELSPKHVPLEYSLIVDVSLRRQTFSTQLSASLN
jgi:hypothetical protein